VGRAAPGTTTGASGFRDASDVRATIDDGRALADDARYIPSSVQLVSQRKRPTMPKKVRDVLSYFVRHPRAADSLEGVVRWRLLEEKLDQDVNETRKALSWLVSQGLLLTDSPKGAKALFYLNGERVRDAERLVSHGRTRKRRAD
jgi:hypothetical protein